MAKLGVYLALGGVGSSILTMFGYEFKLLMWIDTWGPATGWLIRGGMIIVGGILVALSANSSNIKA